MSIKEVVVCDGCGKIIDSPKERYTLYLKSDKFWNGVDTEYNLINLDFCYNCAVKIKETLEKIAKRLEEKEVNENGK